MRPADLECVSTFKEKWVRWRGLEDVSALLKQSSKPDQGGAERVGGAVRPCSTDIIRDADSPAGPPYWKKEGHCKFRAYVGADSP